MYSMLQPIIYSIEDAMKSIEKNLKTKTDCEVTHKPTKDANGK